MPMPSMEANSDAGVILTVGVLSGADRAAVVLPVYNDGNVVDPDFLTLNALTAFINGLLTEFLACISSDAYVTFVNAEGMMDWVVPRRTDFSASAHPGTAPAGLLPNNVTGLITSYMNPPDKGPRVKMSAAKTFMPGVPASWFDGRSFTSDYTDVLQDVSDKFVDGWDAGSGESWYRALCAPKVRSSAQPVPRIVMSTPRDYPATQRRRLIPRI